MRVETYLTIRRETKAAKIADREERNRKSTKRARVVGTLSASDGAGYRHYDFPGMAPHRKDSFSGKAGRDNAKFRATQRRGSKYVRLIASGEVANPERQRIRVECDRRGITRKQYKRSLRGYSKHVA